MRKTLILMILALAYVTQVVAQIQVNEEQIPIPIGKSWEDKHFAEALKNKRPRGGIYCLINDENKYVEAEKLMLYCRDHNYMVNREYETKMIKKYGNAEETVYKFYFMPMVAYRFFAFEKMDKTETPRENLKKSGIAYFFDPEINGFTCLRDGVYWSGTTIDGFIEGEGAGIWEKSEDSYYYFYGTFHHGFPLGKAYYRIANTASKDWWNSPLREVEVGAFSDGMALFRYTNNGGAGKAANGLYGYINQDGSIAIQPTYKTAKAFSNNRAAVKNNKGEDIYIDKNGKFADYTEGQKKIFAAEKAHQDSINAEKERQRLIAKQKESEAKQKAAAAEAELKRRIETNKNPKLWKRGCRLCYRYPNGNEYILATLEDWNDDHTKVKVKIVASPSASRTLNGDVLEKNNTMWVSTRNEGWHLALDEEVKWALENDNSMKQEDSTQIIFVEDLHTCPRCNGRGMVVCQSCNGTGRGLTKNCVMCNGSGHYMCSTCEGTGRIN